MKKLRERQRGFTLIELVVVIAILGVLAAVAVPLITNYLGQSKERAHNAEGERIQAAVEAYYSAPDNSRFTGKRQYPIIGRGQTDQGTLTNQTTSIVLLDNGDPFTAQDHDSDGGTTPAVELWNPVGGTQGADISASWTDLDADGVRPVDGEDTWDSVAVTRGGTTYHTDPRYFAIDFEALVSEGLLKEVPNSASPSNAPEGSTESYTGSYIWYVDDEGNVQSLYTELPSTSGYVDGVFP